MAKLSQVLRCRYLPRNTAGRDFVVGDLHGHRALLERELEGLDFDPARDRVFSVGDLIDRGPDSLATLALIEQPWFHAVLGNHELMLLNYLGCYDSRRHSRKGFVSGSGEWVVDALAAHRRRVTRLAEALHEVPLALHVDAEVPFNVTHGDLCLFRERQEILLRDAPVCVHKADLATNSRLNLGAALRTELLGLSFDRHAVRVSTQPLGRLPITYAGHSPVREVTVHNSHVYIDLGAGSPSARRAGRSVPAVLEHGRFARWLLGVAAARGALPRQPLTPLDTADDALRCPPLAA